MDTQISNLNFKAKYISSCKISKQDKKTGKFIPENVYFTLLDYNSKNDLMTVDTLRNKWKIDINDLKTLDLPCNKWKKMNFINIIASTFNWAKIKGQTNTKIYALTEQAENFENLIPEKVLGTAQIVERSRGKIVLEYLQINPEAINVNKEYNVLFKGSGSAVLTSLKKIYNMIVLHSVSDENVRHFYKANGFWRQLFDRNDFIWICNPIKLVRQLIKH